MKKLKCFIALLAFIFTMSSVIGQNWIQNYDEAQQKSKVEQKNLLINFSGSDWCVPCIKMKKNIFINLKTYQAIINEKKSQLIE